MGALISTAMPNASGEALDPTSGVQAGCGVVSSLALWNSESAPSLSIVGSKLVSILSGPNLGALADSVPRAPIQGLANHLIL